MPANLWDRFFPYTRDDIRAFAADGTRDVVAQRVRVERDRSALYTADIFLYHRKQKRRMVWQFAQIFAQNGQMQIVLPDALNSLNDAWRRLLTDTLRSAILQIERDANLRQEMIVTVALDVPSDVPTLDGAGENRVAPGFAWNELYVHSVKRYLLAMERVRGLNVLDLGCGIGYGAKFLARTANHVTAADADDYPLRYGEETYGDGRITRLNVPYITPERGLPFDAGQFEAIVNFEVIEHVPVETMEAYFAELGRVLKPDGILIMSTPNRHVYVNYPDPYHVALMTATEFRALLESRFRHVEVRGQMRSKALAHTTQEFEVGGAAGDGDEIFYAVCQTYCGGERAIVLPPPTVWEQVEPARPWEDKSTAKPEEKPVAASAPAAAPKPIAAKIAPAKTSASTPPLPAWWPKLWQRLQRVEPGRVLCLGGDWTPWAVLARDGWRIACPADGLPSGAGPSQTLTLDILPIGEMTAEVDALAIFGGDWKVTAAGLGDGGAFLIARPDFPTDPDAWRQEIEQTFGATAHLLDGEAGCGWLFAFGWKGQTVEARHAVLMGAHQNALNMFGGGETQLLETLFGLRERGTRADVSLSLRLNPDRYDLLHLFSLFHADKLPRLASTTTPVVISTIFWDYSELRYAAAVINTIFAQPNAEGITRDLAAWKADTLGLPGISREGLREPADLRINQRAVAKRASALLPNSHLEADLVRRELGELPGVFHVSPNAVRPERFLNARPEPFVERFGLRDFVICAGRFEPMKNQLMLLWAMRDSDLPLVLAGPEFDPQYAALCRKWAGPNAHFVGELSRDLLASAFAAARVHALPSWAETTGLVNLEAGLAGCALVVSDRGGEREYLSGYALAADPGDPASIRACIEQAWETRNPAETDALREHILSRYTWDETARVTAACYESVLRQPLRWFLAPAWNEAETWQPVVQTYVQTAGELPNPLLQLYTGPLAPCDPNEIFARVGAFLDTLGVDTDNCPDIEITAAFPADTATRIILTGGGLDGRLKQQFASRCVPLERLLAA